MESPAPVALRPLSIGEIFDRAIALYVRNFVLFTLMVLTVILPLGIVQYALSPAQTTILQRDIQILQHPPTPSRGKVAPAAFPFTPAQFATLGALLLLSLLLLPIATNTVALGVASLYAGRTPELRACFATVLRRWPRLMGVVALEVAAFGAAYVGGVTAIMLAAVIGVLLARVAIAAAVVLGILAVLALLAWLLLIVMMLLSASFALFGVTMENLSVVPAFTAGMTRIFNRVGFKRSIGMGLAYFALDFGVGIVSFTASALFLLVLKSPILQVAVATVVNAVLTAFLTVLLAVFYYDVRIRREGFDLEADLQRLSAP